MRKPAQNALQPQHSLGRLASQSSLERARQTRSKQRLAQLSTWMPQPAVVEKS